MIGALFFPTINPSWWDWLRIGAVLVVVIALYVAVLAFADWSRRNPPR